MTVAASLIWQEHFQPGERLLWEGVPDRGRLIIGRDILKMVLAAAFALLGGAMFALGVGGLFFADGLSGAVVVLFLAMIGLFVAVLSGGMLVEPFRTPVYRSRYLRYALSDRCAYVQTPAPREGVERYPIAPFAATGIYRERGRDTVWFDARAGVRRTTPPEDSDDPDEDDVVLRLEFMDLVEGERVLGLIRGLQAGGAR